MQEDLNVLAMMDEMLPIIDEEWSRVILEYNSSNPDINWIGGRNEESFHSPIGDPNCPENMQVAKHIQNKIFQWTQASTGMSIIIHLL